MQKFNKEHLAQVVANIGVNGEAIPKTKAEQCIDAVLEGIITLMGTAKDEEPNSKGIRARLTMVGFGTLELRHIEARKHINPRQPSSGERVVKDAHNIVKFKNGLLFDETIN